MPEELWTEVHNIVQEGGQLKPSPRKRNARRQSGCLTNVRPYKCEKRREVKGKGESEKYTQLNAEVQRIARREKKVFLSEQCKEKKNTHIYMYINK